MAPILAIFDSEKEITLETDISDYTIGVYINQKDLKGRPYPVAFYLRKISPIKDNYDIYNKKLLTIVAVFRE
jgi:hypothetical protein